MSTRKPVWYNDIERDAFVETQCRRCFQPDEAAKRVLGTGPGCPHLARAEENKMPKAWTRRNNPVLGDTYRCADKMLKPKVNRRGTAPADTPPLFDDPIDETVGFVPVDGWPSAADFGRKVKDDKGDHA